MSCGTSRARERKAQMPYNPSMGGHGLAGRRGWRALGPEASLYLILGTGTLCGARGTVPVIVPLSVWHTSRSWEWLVGVAMPCAVLGAAFVAAGFSGPCLFQLCLFVVAAPVLKPPPIRALPGRHLKLRWRCRAPRRAGCRSPAFPKPHVHAGVCTQALAWDFPCMSHSLPHTVFCECCTIFLHLSCARL